MMLKPGQTILFQGDSITDCGRDYAAPESLGSGYPMMVAAQLAARYPGSGFKVINRGVSGDRAIDLERRWTQDAVALQPDVASILIGINDTWRRYDRNDPTSAEEFAARYDAILKRLNEETAARILILEPFVLPTPPDRIVWREDLDPKIAKARELAAKYGAIYIPLDGIFAAAGIAASPEAFAYDGVHPTPAGHMLIANAVLAALGA